MDFFTVDPIYQSLFEKLRLRNCAETFDFFLASETASFKKTFIKPMTLASAEMSLPVFFKQYSFDKPSWKFLGRDSKAKREFENYAVFQKLGIASAQPVACGEQRDWMGRLRRAFIITKTISDSTTLLDFVVKHCPNRATAESKLLRKHIVHQLVSMTRTIHQANFFHNDLFWRNILVEQSSGSKIKLWWIDCPRGRFTCNSLLRNRRRLKDLASLDKSAEEFFTPRERIQFVKLYLEKKRLDRKDKNLIREVLAYRQSRWGA